jgi:DNA-binding transcriptional LysR family regulator
LEISYIREFVILAETGAFWEAADKLFISQSSLSKHIQAIEKELKTALFDRTTRRVELNDYGRVFLSYARQIASTQEGYSIAINDMLQNVHGSAAIGSIPSMAQYNITGIIHSFKKSNPGFRLSIAEGDSRKLHAMLESDEIELAFIRQTEEESNPFDCLFCADDHLVAVMPINHPMAGEKSLPLSSLRSEELVVLAVSTMLHDLCERKCMEAGFKMNVLFSGHGLDNIADFIVKGAGVALLMKGQTRFIRNPKAVIVPIEPEIHTQINLCWRKGRQLSSAAARFIKCAKNHLAGANGAIDYDKLPL